MAATDAGRRLTEAHRVAQARLGAQAVADLRTLWPLLDPADLDATFPRWLRAVLPAVQRQRSASAALAANYYRAFQTIESDLAAAFTPVLARPAVVDAVTGAMVITGPASIKRALTRGDGLARAVRTAEALSSAAGQYHVLQGGRETISRTVASDPAALGWARTTSGRCCAFCAVLSSRGYVYSEETVDFEAHPGCSCSAEPTFTRDATAPPGSAEFHQLYNDATRDLPKGDDPINAFRRALDESRAA